MREKKKSSRFFIRTAWTLVLASVCWFALPDRLREHFVPRVAAAGMIFTVNSADDADDGICNLAHCSFREAIKAANANVPGTDLISFNIPGPGVKTIAPTSTLPTITDSAIIDGYSQPGASENTAPVGTNAVLLIELSGAEQITFGVALLRLNSPSVVKGLVINRSKSFGIFVNSNNFIEGNFIGTDPSGTVALGNLSDGILTSGSGNVIGGTLLASRNLISGNGNGMQLAGGASQNVIQRNLIGTAADGTTPLGNRFAGVFLFSGAAETIIGTNGEPNIIAFNGGPGVFHNDSGTGNVVRFNSIHSNGGLGIDISGGTESLTDVTANDEGDSDTGPNNLQNFPVINSASSQGVSTTVSVRLNSKPSTQFHIDVYSSPSCDPSGHGEGERFHVEGDLTTNTSGNGTLSLFPATEFLIGPYITVTATDPSGNTSEFSPCVAAIESTFTVNSTADTNDGACTTSLNGCTLREAMTAANVNAGFGMDEIKFDIPGSGVRTIDVLSALPTMGRPVVIDGYSQPGSSANTQAQFDNAKILIELNGAGAGDVAGIVLAGGNSTLRGLAINRFQSAIALEATKGDNVVAGNFLGTDPTGTTTMPNRVGGITVNGPDNRVGGLNPADRNLISGNSGYGVGIGGVSATRTQIQNNYIGVNAVGSGPLGNSSFGVLIQNGSHTVVGGDLDGSANVISSNGIDGVKLVVSDNNRVQNNYIGTDAAGVSPLGNANVGLSLLFSNNNIIGGFFTGQEANTIAGNGTEGIRLSSSNNNQIERNFIGTNEDGRANLGNMGDGILVSGSGTTNRIKSNSIANNGGLGINLDGGVLPADGVTPNDAGDPDTGPNDLQNFPVLTAAVRDSSHVTVQGTLNSTPSTMFRVEFFGSPSCDPSLNGEGQRYITAANHMTDASGNVNISGSFLSAFLSDQFITATATDPLGNTSEFSLCIPVSDIAASPTPTPTPTPVTLQFGATVYSVIEDCTEVIVSVSRTGNTSQPASVDYLAQPGTASDRSDFTTALGTLNFAPGVTAVSFVVLIHEDSYVEGTETATLVLSNASGATLGGQSQATLEILDDPPEPLANVNDISEEFVCQHYHDFLNRMPDVGGQNFWTNQIEECGANLACIQVRRVNVSAAFFLSIEFQETGFYVIRAQRAAFGKISDVAARRLTYLQVIRDARRVGEGVSVGLPGWEQKLEANRQAYAEQIVGSTEFITMYPLSMTATQYVAALFTSAVVTPSSVETQEAVAAFGGGGTPGRVAAFRKVVDSQSMRNREFRGAFVLMQYFGYLRRNPTDAPDVDDSGYQFWLAKLNQFNGNFQQAEMVKAFISSVEYRQRFGQP
jgi:CSLREA domain-containing protein